MLGGAETSTTSGAESDEEFNRRLPLFKPGLKTRYLHNSEIRDDSPGKSSLNTTEEQSSSLSEAWDNYQVRKRLKWRNLSLMCCLIAGKLFI